MSVRPTFGIEEEVYVIDGGKPTLQSLYYLRRMTGLSWRKMVHTDSNFSRGSDVRQGLMSGIEVSTGVHEDVDPLLEDLSMRRRALQEVCEGLIVPLGHLPEIDAPTNTCALQVHIGNVRDPDVLYANLVRYLPVLGAASANSPLRSGTVFGRSYRHSCSYAIGPLRPDRLYRFQDLIFAKRTGTFEVRLLDPFSDLARLSRIVSAIIAIARMEEALPSDVAAYNAGRQRLAKTGEWPGMERLAGELSAVSALKYDDVLEPPAEESRRFYEDGGAAALYTALDSGYRSGEAVAGELPAGKVSAAKVLDGLAFYYLPKMPYDIWKLFREW